MKSSQRESWPGILQRCWKKNLEIFNDGLNIAVRKVLLVKKRKKKITAAGDDIHRTNSIRIQ